MQTVCMTRRQEGKEIIRERWQKEKTEGTRLEREKDREKVEGVWVEVGVLALV